MNFSRGFWLAFGGIMALLLYLIYQEISPEAAKPAKLSPLKAAEYLAKVQGERQARENWMRTAPDSPLPDSLKKMPHLFSYYWPSLPWRVEAKLSPAKAGGQLRRMADGTIMQPAGEVGFSYQGRSYKLLAFKGEASTKPGEQDIYIPFTDSTSGHTTYGGGRLLNAKVRGDAVELDFNYAYSPYCAWSPTMVCPIPPPENRLALRVEAGEKYLQPH